jgi:hypothetical protein
VLRADGNASGSAGQIFQELAQAQTRTARLWRRSISDGGDGTSACIRFASLLVQVEPRSTAIPVLEVILSRRVTIGWYGEENGHRLGVN